MTTSESEGPRTDPTTVQAPRSRGPRRRKTVGVPLTLRYGVPIALLVWLGMTVFDSWQGGRARLQVRTSDGQPIETMQVDLFALDESRGAPSPPMLIKTESVEGSSLAMGGDDIGEAALVRVTSSAGVGFAHVEPGMSTDIELDPVRTLTGSVQDSAKNGLPGARVFVFGGDWRGVLLGEATTAPDGSFAMEGIGANLDPIFMRVLAPGHARFQVEWDERKGAPAVILEPTRPIRGRLAGPADVVGGRTVRVLSLPGVETQTDVGGGFLLDHVPLKFDRVYLAVPDLPEGFAARSVTAKAGESDVEIPVAQEAVVRGIVRNGHTGKGVSGANVVHDHGAKGFHITACDSSGRFELHRVPPGPVNVRAEVWATPSSNLGQKSDGDGRRRTGARLVQAVERVLVVPGQALEDIEIVMW